MVDRDSPDGDFGQLNGQSINDVQNLANALEAKREPVWQLFMPGTTTLGGMQAWPDRRASRMIRVGVWHDE
jgi:hypothetical protein